MRFGIDLDGVVADYIPPFMREFHKLCAVVPEDDVSKTWNWWPGFGITKTMWDMYCHEIWNSEHFWLTIPPYHDVVKLLREYIWDNPKTEFFYITSRPRLTNDSMLTTCRYWLEANGLYRPNTSIILADRTKNKPQIYKDCGIDKAIDDNLEVVLRAPNSAWLMLRSWNGVDYMNGDTELNTIATPAEFKEKWLVG